MPICCAKEAEVAIIIMARIVRIFFIVMKSLVEFIEYLSMLQN
jgi:hypothetical protein